MKSTIIIIGLLVLCACSTPQPFQTKVAEEGGYSYEYVEGDLLKTRIYTLANGLKVYLSDYDDAPRIQVYIPVKAGGKNDPAENTGLAHYLEHMMFKGNDRFGTLDFEKESVLLDSIENMFNHYAALTDPIERKAYYEKIDKVSNEAAKFAIPNEYDKLIDMIGGKWRNAYTTFDRTVYTVDIPSNELERFLEIEGHRFKKIVNRLFHTELEAVYEEKNRSLDSDQWKVFENLFRVLFKKHPYGTKTVIGTIDHLKNPSITKINEYFNTYYIPNNTAICMSGDLDYTETIKLIDKNFGNWKVGKELPGWQKIQEEPLTSPIEIEVLGPSAEFLNMAYRFNGTGSEDYIKIKLIDKLLSNSEAGLIDLNLLKQQEVLKAGSNVFEMNDYSIHFLTGNAKEGQSLEDVRDLLLEQLELIKSGDFDNSLLEAVVADYKKIQMTELESNRNRAHSMVMAFTNEMSWSDRLQEISKMEQVTKADLVSFAQKHYQNNYAIAYKRNGEDLNKQQVDKPQITKVPLNTEMKSDFHVAIADKKVDKLKPVFIDYKRDLEVSQVGGLKILSKVNSENELFELTYHLNFGKNTDPRLSSALQYMEYVGTDEFTAEEISKQFYSIGCSFKVKATDESMSVTISGLDQNMDKAAVLLESILNSPKPDQDALDKMIERTLKLRSDAQKSKGNLLWRALYNYAKYGPDNPYSSVLTNEELKDLKADELTGIIEGINKLPHRVLYYGPRPGDELTKFIKQYHIVPEDFNPAPETKEFVEINNEISKVFWVDYDMVQVEVLFVCKGEQYNAELVPAARIFNEYIQNIVFQDIREAQGLAYSVYAGYTPPIIKDQSNYLRAYVGTQADKQIEAMAAMKDLLNNMPKSQDAFEIAKKAILNKIESERITKSGILRNFIKSEKRGLDFDIREEIYKEVTEMKFKDLMAFYDQYIKNKNYTTVLVGSRDKMDLKGLEDYGEVRELSLEELFGY